MKLVSCVLTASLLFTTGGPLRAETWSGDKKTSYRQSGTKKWSKARIVASPGVVEVFSVPQGKLVARFDKGNVLVKKGGKVAGSNVEKKIRWGLIGAGAGLVLGGLYLVNDSVSAEKPPLLKGLGGVVVLVSGTWALMGGMFRDHHPYLEISDGLKKIEIRVKKNTYAFHNDIESALGQ